MIRPNSINKAALLASTALALVGASSPAHAQDATWLANPGSNDFRDANNWNPASVPTGTATFGTSTVTAIGLGGAALTFDSWTFTGSTAYTFDIASTQTFTGAGIVNGGNVTITTLDGGLDFKNSASAGNVTIDLADGNFKTSYFRDNSTAANATISISSNDTIWFYNQSTAANATIVNNGTIGTWDNATLGDANITNNARIYFENTSSAGNATIVNNGTSIYFHDSTTAGTATITNNTSLNFWSDSSAGSAHITNAAAGTLEIANSSTLANATVINDGQMNFWGGNPGDVPTAGNATITNNTGATMELRNYATTGSANISNAGAMTFKNSSTAGTATIANNAGGTIEFYDTSTAGTASITNNNELTFYSNTTAGSATITNLGTVLFDGNSTAGSAQLINNGSSAVVNFWTPGPASDGKITAGSLAGDGRFDLNSVELTVGSNNLSTEVTGVLTGDGLVTGTSLIKTGTGTLTLSGTNTYTGATTVDGGTLLVNGSIADSALVFVNPGATLGGTGTVAATFLDNGATLAPGTPASIGTLTVDTALTFCNCSTYAVKVSATDADKTVVNGTAALAGTVQATALAGSFRGRTYTILNATGGLGGTTFDSLTFIGSSISPGARDPHLTYDANNVFLVLDPGTIQLPAGASSSRSSVAGAINKAVESGATPPAAFDALLNMSGARLTNALDQVSGQPAAAGQQTAYNASNQFMTAVFDPFAYGRGLAGSAAAGSAPKSAPAGRSSLGAMSHETPRAAFSDPRMRYWGTVYGGNISTSGSGGASDTTSRVYGIVAGADVALSPDTMLGFALGGGSSSFSVSNGLGHGDADMVQAGLFGKHTMGAAYVFAGLSYTYQDVTTNRTVTVSEADELEAKFDANTFGGRIEGGYRFATPFVGITPYAALQVTQINLPGYEESAISGSNAFALDYESNHTTVKRTELGARFDRAFKLDDALLTLRSRIAWAHDEGNDSAISASFLSLPGSAFTVNGAVPSENLALVSAGAEMKWLNDLSVVGTFEGEFSENTEGYAGKGAVRYAW